MKKYYKFILLGIFIVFILLVIGIKSFNFKGLKHNTVPSNEEKLEIKNEDEETNIINDQSNQEELKSEIEVDKNSNADENVPNKNTTSSATSTTTSTNTNSNTESKKDNSTPEQNPTVPEEKNSVNSESQTTSTSSYVGVPSPNDFYYSFHRGHIDKNYTTLDGCYSRTAEVSLIDTVDIINTTCYEVLDGQGTVLGIYMYVNCSSGNCERYKKMVGIETD